MRQKRISRGAFAFFSWLSAYSAKLEPPGEVRITARECGEKFNCMPITAQRYCQGLFSAGFLEFQKIRQVGWRLERKIILKGTSRFFSGKSVRKIGTEGRNSSVPINNTDSVPIKHTAHISKGFAQTVPQRKGRNDRPAAAAAKGTKGTTAAQLRREIKELEAKWPAALVKGLENSKLADDKFELKLYRMDLKAIAWKIEALASLGEE